MITAFQNHSFLIETLYIIPYCVLSGKGERKGPTLQSILNVIILMVTTTANCFPWVTRKS